MFITAHKRRGSVWQWDVWQGACLAGGGHVWQGGMAGGYVISGACMVGRGGLPAGQTATEAGGMRPTGMHSCFK